MIKKLLTGLNLFVFIAVFSQSGIGTHTPEGALDINSPNNNWGLVLPHVDQAENTQNPTGKNIKKGTIVYDLKQNCIKFFNGSEWSGCILAPTLIKLECSSVVLNQEIIANYPIAAGTTVSIPYSNPGEALNPGEITISSTNLTGLTAVLSSGFINKGSGNLVFSISGTPSAYGEAKFSLNIAGATCEFIVVAKNHMDIEVPPITNLTCDVENQLNHTLNGKHIINGKEVAVTYTNIPIISQSFNFCNASTSANSFWVGSGINSSILTIVFSRPVTNVGIVFTATDAGEEFSFTTNAKKPIQLKVNSTCQQNIKITDNKMNFSGKVAIGGNITVGGEWFTELTFKHNGALGGSVIDFCLNNSNAL